MVSRSPHTFKKHPLTAMPRFHKVNITAVRVTNAPILALVSLYERKYLWRRARNLAPPMRHSWIAMWERMGAHGDLQAVFDADPPQEIIDEMDDVDDILSGEMWNGGDYVTALRRRRGSRSVMSDASGVWSRSRGESRVNGFRRRRGMSEDEHHGPEAAEEV